MEGRLRRQIHVRKGKKAVWKDKVVGRKRTERQRDGISVMSSCGVNLHGAAVC